MAKPLGPAPQVAFIREEAGRLVRRTNYHGGNPYDLEWVPETRLSVEKDRITASSLPQELQAFLLKPTLSETDHKLELALQAPLVSYGQFNMTLIRKGLLHGINIHGYDMSSLDNCNKGIKIKPTIYSNDKSDPAYQDLAAYVEQVDPFILTRELMRFAEQVISHP